MKITIRNLQKKTPISSQTRRNIVRTIEKAFSLSPLRMKGLEISVCVIDDCQIRKLNKKFLKADRTTDVLAFDMTQPGRPAADIAISAQTAELNSRIYKTNAAYEVCLYSAHAALHLIGYDDATKKGFKEMERIALRLLSRLKIKPSKFKCQSIKPKP
ncbi:MAG: rRNA maturation RNase YbeY [Candidatus Omnitrophica bacterium]|nr:rRNA maturation RNase YbeY [Candidatus Omnitrophota bacterium]